MNNKRMKLKMRAEPKLRGHLLNFTLPLCEKAFVSGIIYEKTETNKRKN